MRIYLLFSASLPEKGFYLTSGHVGNFFCAAAGFNEASQYIALMASGSFLFLVQKLVCSALSSRHPLDTGKHELGFCLITGYEAQQSSGIFFHL